MNLRIDTQVINRNGRACDMTLFHLRIHDIQTREFSLRRYCRDSGREVCNSTRKTQKAITQQRRQSLQRSLSNALNSLRPRSAGESKLSTNGATLQRNDSGYGSMHSVDFQRGDSSRSGRDEAYQRITSTTAPVKLEFSNYAQVEVKRSGSLKHRRCEFDYWGARYSWRRVTRSDGASPSFHLLRSGSEHAVAYIVPCALTKMQEMQERSRGNWVPPCTMWIADDTIIAAQKDISDVIIASGLLALVDSSFLDRCHRKASTRLSMPGAAEAKRLLSELFRRGSSMDDHNATLDGRPWTVSH